MAGEGGTAREGPQEGASSVHRRGTRRVAVLLAPMAFIFASVYGVGVEWGGVSAVAGLAALGFGVGGGLARQRRDRAGGALVSFTFVTGATAVAWLAQGIHSPGVAALVAAPSIALATTGRRGAYVAAAGAGLGLVSLVAGHQLGVRFEPSGAEPSFLVDGLAAAFVLTLVLVVSVRYDQLLADAQAEAVAHAQAKERFFTKVGHELRTPLSTIIGHTEGLLEEGHRGEEVLHQVLRAARHQLSLVHELLEHEGAASAGWAVRRVPGDPAGVVVAVAHSMEAQAASAGASLQCELLHGVLALLDPSALRQVLRHVLTHALAASEGKPVRLVMRADANEVWIDVVDEGSGMTAMEAAVAFEPFARGEATDGSGLGLASSRQLCASMGGRLELFTRPGGGSTFRIVLARSSARSPTARFAS